MLPLITQPAVAPACFRPDFVDLKSVALLPSARLARTFAAGDRTKWTLDVVVEIDVTVHDFYLLTTYSAGGGGNNHGYLKIEAGGRLALYSWDGAGTDFFAHTAPQMFRAPGKYHIHIEYDSNHATQAERLRVWVNGVRITLTFTTPVAPGRAADFNSAREHNLYGYRHSSTTYGNRGKGGRAYWIGGANVPVSEFGEWNIHGVWVLREPAIGTWGVNGFHIDFAAMASLGNDVSGQGNHFTLVGLTSAAQLGDDGYANTYSTLNRLKPESGTIGDDGATWGGIVNQMSEARGTIPASAGKVQLEMAVGATLGSNLDGRGIVLRGLSGRSIAVASSSTQVYYNNGLGLSENFGGYWVAGENVGLVLDFDADTVQILRNGVVAATYVDQQLAGEVFYGGIYNGGTNSRAVPAGWRLNFGAVPFSFPVSGAGGWCTDALAEPSVKDPAEGLAQATATGANLMAVLDVLTSGWGGAAYLEIVKRRDGAEDWRWRWSDDPANAMATNSTVGKGPAPALTDAGAYVGHRLRLGARYGRWTAEVAHVTGTPTTVTHGLSTARAVVVAKRVDAAGDWFCHHPDLAAGHLIKLNTTGPSAGDGTLTGFGANGFTIAAAAPSGTYRVLVLAQRDGHQDVGKYAGNGSADGAHLPATVLPLLHLGRGLGSGHGTMLYDAARDPANPATRGLILHTNAGDNTSEALDFGPGGVKARFGGGWTNTAGATVLTLTIGRPIGGICVAPATAR